MIDISKGLKQDISMVQFLIKQSLLAGVLSINIVTVYA